MKRLLFGFVLGYCLSSIVPVRAQQEHQAEPGLNLRDVVEVLADYEVLHPHVPLRTEWFGWTDPNEQRIFVIQNADSAARRKTMIHELYHVQRKYNGRIRDGHDEEEAVVQVLSTVTYRELFGVKVP